MIISRFLEESDYFLLEEALAKDTHHTGTNADFFYEQGTVCSAFEDELGVVMFVRGNALSEESLRLDIQFMDNMDFRRNRRVLLECFHIFADNCKKNGWKELVFFSASPLLIKFCVKHFGFENADGVLRKQL